MATDPRLESYLSSLDKALGPVPVSERADIVTEIKSHILDAQEKDPAQSLSSILASLGEPQTVANRYLLERGLRPGKPSRSPMVKWLTIGFLGTLGIFSLTIVVLAWSFTPLIAVDDKNDRVRILGGLIDIDGDAGTVKVGSSSWRGEFEMRRFDGSRTLDRAKFREIVVPFTNGKLELSASSDNEIHWKCKVTGGEKSAFIDESGGKFTLNLERSGGSKCDIQLPKGIPAVIRGANGKLEIEKPVADISVKLDNGKVSIEPDASKKYRYDLSVSNGIIDDFLSSDARDALKIKVVMANGQIKQN